MNLANGWKSLNIFAIAKRFDRVLNNSVCRIMWCQSVGNIPLDGNNLVTACYGDIGRKKLILDPFTKS